MNKISLLLLTPLFLCAKVHYAKVEPYESVVMKSAVSGLVTEVDLASEGTVVGSKRVVHIDDTLDKKNLQNTKKSMELLEKMLHINKKIATGLKGSVARQESYYSRLSGLSTASKTQKDNAYSALTASKTQYLSTKEKIMSLEKQILDMRYKVAQLEDSVVKKSLVLKHKYVYQFLVKEGDFVAPGSPLVSVKDTTRAKLVLFLDADEVLDVETKKVYLDDVETEYKVAKVWKMADEKFISSYRAEIYIPSPEKMFSKLIKVEIK